MNLTLWRHAQLATLVPGATPWGLVEDGALLVEGELLRWVGPESELGAATQGLTVGAEHDLGGIVLVQHDP